MAGTLALELVGPVLLSLGLGLVAVWLYKIRAELRANRTSAVERFWFEEMLLRPNQQRIAETFDALEQAPDRFLRELVVARSGGAAEPTPRTTEETVTRHFRQDLEKHLGLLTARVVDPLGAVSPTGRDALRDVIAGLETSLYPGSPPDLQRIGGMAPAVRELRLRFLAALHRHHLEAMAGPATSGGVFRQGREPAEEAARRGAAPSGLRLSPQILGVVFLLSVGTWLFFYADPNLRLDTGATAVVVGFWLLVALAGRWILDRRRA